MSIEDDPPPRKRKRGAVMVFLIGWLFLPVFIVALGELRGTWYQIGRVAMLAFIALLIVAMVQVVRRF